MSGRRGWLWAPCRERWRLQSASVRPQSSIVARAVCNCHCVCDRQMRAASVDSMTGKMMLADKPLEHVRPHAQPLAHSPAFISS